MIHRLIVPLTLLALSVPTGAVLAQGAFPAPLPGGPPASPPANDPAFPPVNGAAPTASIGAPAAASPFPNAGAAPSWAAPADLARRPARRGPGRSAGSLHEGVPAFARGCGKEGQG